MFICLLFFVTTPQLEAFENLIATKGQHFEKTLDKESFFKGEENVEFSVSLDEMADLPTWLNFQQKDPSSPGDGCFNFH